MKTIIYLTENLLDEEIAKVCRKQLKLVAGDNPIISVSQKPIDFGKNICVGEIGRNWVSLYRQQLEGLKAATTDFVAIAEHDVLYTEEHFNWEPPDLDKFYYNENCWFVSWDKNRPDIQGMYSHWRIRNKPWRTHRKPLSMLICSKELLIKSIEERLLIYQYGIPFLGKMGEPGSYASNIVQATIDRFKKVNNNEMAAFVENHVIKFQSICFSTKYPCLDIRHITNFTGSRRGNIRKWDLQPWGNFKEFMKGMIE